jgi:hypothetical protein
MTVFGSRTIRPSSLTTYADCSRRWAARQLVAEIKEAGYRLRFEAPTHIGAAVGSGVHAAAAYTLGEKRESGTLGNDSEAEDRAIEEFEARAEHGLMWDDTTDTLGVAKRQIARMTKMYRRTLAPEIEPLLIEERLEGDLGDGWSISGQLDTLNGDPDAALRDLKTGTRQRANGVQYGAYVMLFRGHGYTVDRISEDYLRRVRIDREQPEPEEHPIAIGPAIEDAWALIEDIKRSARIFENRLSDPNGRAPHTAFRANPGSSMCGDKWCTAWGTDFCKAHRR